MCACASRLAGGNRMWSPNINTCTARVHPPSLGSTYAGQPADSVTLHYRNGMRRQRLSARVSDGVRQTRKGRPPGCVVGQARWQGAGDPCANACSTPRRVESGFSRVTKQVNAHEASDRAATRDPEMGRRVNNPASSEKENTPVGSPCEKT
jgi:hypothetical protein